MLKIKDQAKGASVWLVGPEMKIGSLKTCEVQVASDNADAILCTLHISGNNIILERLVNNELVEINNKPVAAKSPLVDGDALRVGDHVFSIIDPDAASKHAVEAVRQGAKVQSSQQNAINQEASGWMLQGLNSGVQNKRFPIDGRMYLGRSKECELHLAFDRLSRKHALLSVIDGVLLVEDQDSSNGTYINGKQVKRGKLKPGDTLAFDRLEFTVLGKSDAKEGAAARWDNSLNQTVVRSAVTPEMIAQAKSQSHSREQEVIEQITPISAEKPNGNKFIVVISLVVLAAVGLGFYFS